MLTNMPPGFKDSFYQFVLCFALSAYFLTHQKLYKTVKYGCYIFYTLDKYSFKSHSCPNVLHYSILANNYQKTAMYF